MKVGLVSFYFPPAGGGGVRRPLKLALYLPALGIVDLKILLHTPWALFSGTYRGGRSIQRRTDAR